MAWCWIRHDTRQIHPGQFFPGRTPRSSSTGMYGRRSRGRAQSMMKLRSRHQCDTPVVRPCSPSVASRALIYRASNTSVNMGAFRVLKIMKLCNIFLVKTNQRRAIAILLSKQFCYKKKRKIDRILRMYSTSVWGPTRPLRARHNRSPVRHVHYHMTQCDHRWRSRACFLDCVSNVFASLYLCPISPSPARLHKWLFSLVADVVSTTWKVWV